MRNASRRRLKTSDNTSPTIQDMTIPRGVLEKDRAESLVMTRFRNGLLMRTCFVVCVCIVALCFMMVRTGCMTRSFMLGLEPLPPGLL